jgi:SAM-dependent methyltransferase
MADIYTNPKLYDAIHKNISSDKKMITHYAKICGGPVLELASGTGRLAKYIIDLGLPYTGIDTSKEFIQEAKFRFGDSGVFRLDDMQKFQHKYHYDFIFIGFNSFLHNLTDKNAKDCLSSVNNHLSQNGIFFLSAFIPDPVFLYKGDELQPATSFFTYRNKQCRVMEKNTYHEDTQINHITWTIETDGILSDESYTFKQRMYPPHMMDILLNENGFTIREKYGDWDRAPLDEFSPMQIYICRKK